MGHGIEKKKVVRILNTLEGIIMIGVLLTSYYGLDGYIVVVGCTLLCLLDVIASVIDYTLAHILETLALIIAILGYILTTFGGLEGYVKFIGFVIACLLYIIASVLGDTKDRKIRIIVVCVSVILYCLYLYSYSRS